MAGFFLGGSLPFVENAFGIVTGISLLELGDVTHPLLQELVRRAPGTHNHSITVGAIAEAAAEPIGANALLVRVGAYFHDIGKMLKPHYFVENQAGAANRHANLAPAMSTLIIIGHVKDGVDLAGSTTCPSRSSTSSSSTTARRWSSTSTTRPTAATTATPTRRPSRRAPSATPAPSRRRRRPAS